MDWFEAAQKHLAEWKARDAAYRQRANDYYSPQAWEAIRLAAKEARGQRLNYVGAEHLLLGLIQLGSGVAAETLGTLGLRLDGVRAEVEKASGPGRADILDPIPYTPRAKSIIQAAKKEAEALGQTLVSPEHLLLGLLAEPGGLAAQVFRGANVDVERARVDILGRIAGAPAIEGSDPGKPA